MTTGAVLYRRSAETLWRLSADAVVVLPVGAGDVFTLRGSGAALWDVLAQPRTLEQIVDSLAASHKIARETVAEQIEPVIRELVARSAVHESDS